MWNKKNSVVAANFSRTHKKPTCSTWGCNIGARFGNSSLHSQKQSLSKKKSVALALGVGKNTTQ